MGGLLLGAYSAGKHHHATSRPISTGLLVSDTTAVKQLFAGLSSLDVGLGANADLSPIATTMQAEAKTAAVRRAHFSGVDALVRDYYKVEAAAGSVAKLSPSASRAERWSTVLALVNVVDLLPQDTLSVG